MNTIKTAVLDGVAKSYGSTTVLHPTSLVLHPGVIGLLGPNGAGKSTLLRLLATTLPPSRGDIQVAGHDVSGSMAERTAARRKLGYLPQEVVFPRGMTAFGFLDYIAVLKEWRMKKERHQEVRRVLALVNLDDKPSRRIGALSGGQRRRLAIAQALMGTPELIILDEPTTGLDPQQRASLRSLLSSLGSLGTVLLSTHQTEDVAALCDRVVILDAGRIRFDGTVTDFVRTARGQVHADTQANEGAIATWRTGDGRIRSIGGVPGPRAAAAEPSVEDAYLLLQDRLRQEIGNPAALQEEGSGR